MDPVKTNIISTPHIDSQGTKRYFLSDGKTLHRVDGPAVGYSYGNKEYYLNGVEYPFEVWNRLRKMLWVL